MNNPLGHCDNHKRQCSHFEVVMGKRWLFPYVWQQGSLQQSIIVIEDSQNISRLRKLRFLKYIEDTNCLRVDNVAIVKIILLHWHMFCIHSTNPNQVKFLNFKPFPIDAKPLKKMSNFHATIQIYFGPSIFVSILLSL